VTGEAREALTHRRCVSRRALPVALATLLVAMLVSHAGAAPTSGPACGAAGAARVVDGIDDGIARGIYAQELSSTEVSADLQRITSSSALASAVAAGDRKRIENATHAIVYTPIWHIVRLRILSPSGEVLADVGGPYILAPVSGQITSGGKIVGSFVMSVQDDAGYKKLFNHITRVPVELYLGGRPLMGTLSKPPSSPPSSGPLQLGGVGYAVDSFSVEAFPTGTLQVAVFVPSPSGALAASSCAAVKLATDAAIVSNVATGLMISGHDIYSHMQLFITQAYGYTHVPVFTFRDGHEQNGTNHLPGSRAPAAPKLTPSTSEVSYDGARYLVAAQRPFPPDWIYVLSPASLDASAGATGATGSSAN